MPPTIVDFIKLELIKILVKEQFMKYALLKDLDLDTLLVIANVNEDGQAGARAYKNVLVKRYNVPSTTPAFFKKPTGRTRFPLSISTAGSSTTAAPSATI